MKNLCNDKTKAEQNSSAFRKIFIKIFNQVALLESHY